MLVEDGDGDGYVDSEGQGGKRGRGPICESMDGKHDSSTQARHPLLIALFTGASGVCVV